MSPGNICVQSQALDDASLGVSVHDWIVPDWPAPQNVRALITTRAGGVSRGAFAGLNLGLRSGDDIECVKQNRASLRLWLPAEPLWLRQVHGTTVVEADAGASGSQTDARMRGCEDDAGARVFETDARMCGREADAEARRSEAEVGVSGPEADVGVSGPEDDARASRSEVALLEMSPEADAAIARRPGTVCAALSADCLPLLLCDQAGTVVAAAHAGWRGLCSGVIEQTLCAMGRPPQTLLAFLGPAIGPAAYEVGAEVRDAFIAADAQSAAAFAPGTPGKFHADLYALARRRLARSGVEGVFGGGYCTYAERERFYSYRRDGTTGRMASLIWLR